LSRDSLLARGLAAVLMAAVMAAWAWCLLSERGGSSVEGWRFDVRAASAGTRRPHEEVYRSQSLVTGTLVLAGGEPVVSGARYALIDILGSFTATSTVAAVNGMHIWTRYASCGCPVRESRLAAYKDLGWMEYASSKVITATILSPRSEPFCAVVEYRDERDNVSGRACDSVRVEVDWSLPTSTPTPPAPTLTPSDVPPTATDVEPVLRLVFLPHTQSWLRP
jgi:hypothetical protein